MASFNDSPNQARSAQKCAVYSSTGMSAAENGSTSTARELRRSAENPITTRARKSLKPFLQHASCLEAAPKLALCRECRMARDKKKKAWPHVCRFVEFRKLRYDKDGIVRSCGFSVSTDATREDLKMFFPSLERPPEGLDVTTAVFILSQVCGQFSAIVSKEREGKFLHAGDEGVAWKHILQGVREMCDVCDTTLFNIHWVCGECGFAVCIDCYKAKRNGTAPAEDSPWSTKDEFQWFLCADRTPHQVDKLMMTEIIPGVALWDVYQELQRICLKWNIPSQCRCGMRTCNCPKRSTLGPCKALMSQVFTSLSPERECSAVKEESRRAPERSEQLFADAPPGGAGNNVYGAFGVGSLMSSLANVTLHDSNKEDDDLDAMRELLGCRIGSDALKPTSVEQVINEHVRELARTGRGFHDVRKGRQGPPVRVSTLTTSSRHYTAVRHSWLCNGKLLVLHEPRNEDNAALFQEQWRRGQPVLVTDVCKELDMALWHPDGFCRDFGDVRNDLVNCRTGAILKNKAMRRFWEGFENFGKRMKDADGEGMLLKLKDWPPGDDFSDVLPSRFNDLMKVLPLPEYTLREGVFNLAARLPESFVRPDLGPKMYIAYGSALYPKKGTTNLHLDVSDAVNVMVYVGIPKDGKDEEHVHEALKAIDEGSCDSLMRKRAREKGAKPGALWHIFRARDADKIRKLLNQVAVERGQKLDRHDDPIHDQSWYLDEDLRDRLYREHGVEGYAIAQCLGDAVFIPAGAPHQVRNLHSCIKVAEDFVSPENVAHCLRLTDEFRRLSDTHTNHEDKVQIKNVVYHAVKDALAILLASSPPNDNDAK